MCNNYETQPKVTDLLPKINILYEIYFSIMVVFCNHFIHYKKNRKYISICMISILICLPHLGTLNYNCSYLVFLIKVLET